MSFEVSQTLAKFTIYLSFYSFRRLLINAEVFFGCFVRCQCDQVGRIFGSIFQELFTLRRFLGKVLFAVGVCFSVADDWAKNFKIWANFCSNHLVTLFAASIGDSVHARVCLFCLNMLNTKLGLTSRIKGNKL